MEGDGISEAFLETLWCCDELGYKPSVWVPDSIFYKFGQPSAWYFTGTDGKLKRKHRTNLVNVKIEERFFSKCGACDIVACFVNADNSEVEYFDRRGLCSFLYDGWKENNGLLQRFVQPQGLHNAHVRAIWSPKICMIERRVNVNKLRDNRFGLFERAVTYEGPEHFSSLAPMRGSALTNQIQKLCDCVQAHVAEVSFQKQIINRMVVNFKVDAKDRVWLLWTTSVRLEEQFKKTNDPVNINSILQLPCDLHLVEKANHSSETMSEDQKKELTSTKKCPSCGEKSLSFYPVQYKIIISHFDQLVSILKSDTASDGHVPWPPDPIVVAAAGGVGFGPSSELKCKRRTTTTTKNIDLCIPPVIRQAHPSLTVPDYREYRRDPLFLYTTTSLCESCFLAYSDLATIPRCSHVTHVPGLIGYDTSKKVPYSLRSQPVKNLVKRKVLPPANRQKVTIENEPWMPSTSAPPKMPSPIRPENCGAAPSPAPEDDQLANKREESFFRDLHTKSRDDQSLPKGHPLTHMVTTQSILRIASTSSIPAKEKTKKSPYMEKPSLVEATSIAGSISSSGSVSRIQKYSSPSSLQHRDFLMKTLEEVQGHLATTNTLRAWKDRAEVVEAITTN